MKKVIKLICTLVLVVLFFMYTPIISDGILMGINRCLNIIIPSLFFMMAISDYLTRSGVLNGMKILFRPIAKILGVNESLVPLIILSNIGGYPIGIKLISTLCDDNVISIKQAHILSMLCFSSGPAFSISAVGICVFRNKKIGIAIFLSILLTNLLVCMVLSRIFKLKTIDASFHSQEKYTMTDAVESASKSLFSMCAVIIMFSGLCSLAEYTVLQYTPITNDTLRGLALSLLDVTYLTNIKSVSFRIIPCVVFAISLGGACVWLQNSRLCSKKINLCSVFAGRVVISLFSAAIYVVIFSFSCREILADAEQNVRLIVNIDNFIPSICLIIMIFLLFSKKRLAFQKKV